jgi:cytoskeleton protein RodZ
VFTFSGDCWVNIYDATGKRIAWGVKKAGYVMTIQGKAPLRVTVGKPELTRVVFNDEAVDMSPFNVGNIAKFTLPVVPE